jgi:putative drug exporter of the RND superfamily
MATFLYRLGKASYQRAWTVVLSWLLALVVIGGGGIALAGETQESFAIPGSESQIAFDRLEAVFPTFGGASAQAVVATTDGERLDSPANTVWVEKLTAAIEESEGVTAAVSPFDEFAGRAVSDDGQFGYIQVRFDLTTPEVTDAMVDSLLKTAETVSGAALRVEYGGTIFQNNAVGLTIAEVFGLMIAALVLIVTFRSFRPTWMPLSSAIVGVGIVVGILFFLARGITISSSAPLLAVMLGLAVGIDYSLFILSRHRTQLALGEDPLESAATSVGTAGNAVVFAGLTVIIALLGLFVVGIPFLSVMGASAAFAVAVAIAAAITLLPALMGVLGESLRPKPGSQAMNIATLSAERPSVGRRWVRLIIKRPLFFAIASIATLGTIALPALSLDLNLPSGGQEPVDSTQRKAYDLISEGFGPGYNGPLLVTVDISGSMDIIEDLEALQGELELVPGVDYVGQGFPSPGLDTGILQVVPEFAPDSIETKELVGDLRERAVAWEEKYGTQVAITGATAIGVDVSERIQNALLPFGLVVVGLSIILLLAVFRSLVVPIKAALGFALSVTAAFGVVVAVFQWGWFAELVGVDTPGPILSFMPIILMAVLFGLAMDYQVFLVSGMREQNVRTGDWRFAIEEGYAGGARVVTAAALIMFFVFFSFVPMGYGTIKPIALGLAVGIAFDAFVVRMTLVPALMALFKKSSWWLPKFLDRAIPHADVEGEKLRDHIRDVEWASHSPRAVAVGEYLVPKGQHHTASPISFEWTTGQRIDVVADPEHARVFAATVSGYLPHQSGALHVKGHPLPSEHSVVKTLVSQWSPPDSLSLQTLGELLEERLAWSAHWSRFSKSNRSQEVHKALATLNSHARNQEAGDYSVTFTHQTLLHLLTQEQRIVAFALLATIDSAPLCLINHEDPIRDIAEVEMWWRALNLVASENQTLALFSLPPARALAGASSTRQCLDLEAKAVQTT